MTTPEDPFANPDQPGQVPPPAYGQPAGQPGYGQPPGQPAANNDQVVARGRHRPGSSRRRGVRLVMGR